MGQANLKRTQFIPRASILTLVDSNVHELDFVGYLEIADTVDVIDVDGNGNILSVLADNAIVLAINKATKKVILDQSVDTSVAVGTPKIRVQNIDDGQEAIDRLYRRKFSGAVAFDLKQNIIDFEVDVPSIGKTTYYVADASFWRAGDDLSVIADTGVIAASATIDSVNVNADDVNNYSSVVISSNVSVNLGDNPYLQNLTIDMEGAVRRNQERIDQIDRPIDNVDLGIGDGSHLSFYLPELFLQGSSKLMLDGIRKKIGTRGTYAFLVQGSLDAQITLQSLINGLKGNNTTIEVVAGAGINVSVSGNSNSGYAISVSDNGGAITSKELADALNADADAKRIVQAIYGGNGTGVVAPFGPANLTGGLDDGTGDYCEIEQVYQNQNTGTGFKIVSFHIRPNERNRMNSAPDQDEELTVDYAKAHDNADR